MGITDAQNAINKGASESLNDLIHYHALKKKGDKRMLKHSFGTFLEAKQQGEFEEYDFTEDPHMKKYQFLTA
jgi:hypothetical protein